MKAKSIKMQRRPLIMIGQLRDPSLTKCLKTVSTPMRRAFPRCFTANCPWYNCGVTNHKVGRSERAHQCYTRAIQLESNVLALVNRGWIHFERQDLAETEKDWQSSRPPESD